MIFPQYRKYANNQSYFKITSSLQLEETKVLGNYYQIYVLNAQKLPDRNFIADLLAAGGGHILPITEAEFIHETELIRKTKELMAG